MSDGVTPRKVEVKIALAGSVSLSEDLFSSWFQKRHMIVLTYRTDSYSPFFIFSRSVSRVRGKGGKQNEHTD